MTQQYSDDVTGEIIGGDTERWWRISGLRDVFGQQDITDLDTLIDIIRDHLTSKSPQPLDIYTMARIPEDKPPALARYAPPAAVNDAPFDPINPYKIPSLNRPSFRKPYTFVPTPPKPIAPEELARLDRIRNKYIRTLAALCGCNNLDVHGKVNGEDLP